MNTCQDCEVTISPRAKRCKTCSNRFIAENRKVSERHVCPRCGGKKNPSSYVCRTCWSEDHTCALDSPQRQRNLMAKYGITPEIYEELLEEQGGVCATPGCGNVGDPWLHVDHQHSSGKVRGLLCVSCNLSLGNARDSPEILQGLIEYLERPLPEINYPERSVHNRNKTYCPHGHEYTPENTYIKKRSTGDRRECRTCHRDQVRESLRVKRGYYERNPDAVAS